GVVPTNYPATTEPHGLRRPKSTNALIARSRSKRQRHDPPRLRRARRERPCCRRAADERDELAALHSITSSARASTVGGTSRPSALAVRESCVQGQGINENPIVQCDDFQAQAFWLLPRLHAPPAHSPDRDELAPCRLIELHSSRNPGRANV